MPRWINLAIPLQSAAIEGVPEQSAQIPVGDRLAAGCPETECCQTPAEIDQAPVVVEAHFKGSSNQGRLNLVDRQRRFLGVPDDPIAPRRDAASRPVRSFGAFPSSPPPRGWRSRTPPSTP